MRQWRQDRLDLEAAQRRHKRRNDVVTGVASIRAATTTTSHLVPYPPTDLFWSIPNIDSMMEKDTDGIPSDIWKLAEGDLTRYVKAWRSDVLCRLHRVLQGNSGNRTPEIIAEDLASSTSAFLCTICRSHHWYPEVIDHCLAHGERDRPNFDSLVIW